MNDPWVYPRAVAVWLLMGCGGSAASEGSRSPAPAESAPSFQVGQGTVLISYPAQAGADLTWPRQPSPAGYPGREWRATIQAGDAVLFVASLQLVADSTQSLGPYASTAEAMTHAQLRECTLGGHIIACAKSLEGDVTIEGNELVLRIRDSSMIKRLQANRHLRPSARLSYRRNRQEIVWQGIVYLEFR